MTLTLAPMTLHVQKSNFAYNVDHLHIRDVKVLLTMPLICVILMLVPVISHNPTSHVILDFDNLDLRSAMVPLTVLFASHDAYDNASGIMTKKVMLHHASIILT